MTNYIEKNSVEYLVETLEDSNREEHDRLIAEIHARGVTVMFDYKDQHGKMQLGCAKLTEEEASVLSFETGVRPFAQESYGRVGKLMDFTNERLNYAANPNDYTETVSEEVVNN